MVISHDKILQIINYYGDDFQKVKACEELSELEMVVLQDWTKGGMPITQIAEEIADVYVVLRELEYIFHLDSRDIQPIIDAKLDRAVKSIEADNG